MNVTEETAGIRERLTAIGATSVHGLIGPEQLAALSAETEALVARFYKDGCRDARYWHYTDKTGTDRLYRIHELEAIGAGAPAIAALIAGRELRALAETALDAAAVPTVAALIVKTPGVAGVPWHRDRTDVGPGEAVNLSVYLDDSDGANGCLEFVPASHRLGEHAVAETVRRAGPVRAVPVPAGGVAVHDVRLVHGAGDNTSQRQRRCLIVEFVLADGGER